MVAEERPRVALTYSFSKLFKDIGLSPRAVSTTFGSRVNTAICLQVSCRVAGMGSMTAIYKKENIKMLEAQLNSIFLHKTWEKKKTTKIKVSIVVKSIKFINACTNQSVISS